MHYRVLVLNAAAVAVALAGSVSTAGAATIDLGYVLANGGYELGTTSQWTVTKPNATYEHNLDSNFGVNLAVNPLNPCCADGSLLPALTAPVGNDFVAVTNPTKNGDIRGKLVHDAVAQSASAGDLFQVTIWANRGRLGSDANSDPSLQSSPPALSIQFLGWDVGATPTVSGNNDNWSRTAAVNTSSLFSNWGAAGAWTSQTFTFTTPENLAFVSLAISGLNNNHDQYVAWDVQSSDGTTPVPEPASMFLLGLGLVGMAHAVKRFKD
jgi:hypothetical protein